jgi:hypothetical protein
VQSDSLAKVVWHLQGAKATVACGPFLAEVDVERPTRGLHNLRLSNDAVDGWLLGVDVANAEATPQQPQLWQPADVYVRGSDLVVTYREHTAQPFQLQIYWRLLPTTGVEALALEAIVSIQTREWEAYPAISISSALDVSGAQLHAGGVRFLSYHDWSYVEASPVGDFEPTIAQAPAGLRQANWQFGKRFMERGVIRRLRVRGAVVANANAESALDKIRAAFATEAPPLTA